MIVFGTALSSVQSQGAVSAQERKELLKIRREVLKVRGLLRRKNTDEATQIVEDAQQRLDKLVDDGIDKDDRIVKGLQNLIENSRNSIRKQTGVPADEPTDPNQPATEVEIPRPTGDETVSFTRDIAPFLANICLRCHSGNSPRSGFSLETFEKLLVGGDSGQVVLPGDLDGSRLWDLVGKQKPIKMPPGANLLITRKNHSDLRTWIQEGAKFDGKDPKAPLRSLVPSVENRKAAELASLNPEQFAELRLKRSHEQWRKVLPREEPLVEQGTEVIALGNVSPQRLKQTAEWAAEHVARLRSFFDDKSPQLWKGRLALFVLSDRYAYDEFNLVVDKRRVPREVVAHSTVNATFEDAYVVLQDVGDRATETSPALHGALIDQMTGAYLKRSGESLPNWLVQGTGLALAAKHDKTSPYYQSLRRSASQQLRSLGEPWQVFDDATFSPTQIGPIGLTLVEFLWKSHNQEQFRQLISTLEKDAAVDSALEEAYDTTAASIGRAYLASQR